MHAKGRGRINAFSVGVKAANEEDDDANNGLRRRRRRRNRTTNKTDYDEETGGKQRQKMTTRDLYDDDDDDDDDAEENNNSKDDDEFVLSNVRPNRTANEEEEEEEAIKERARKLKIRLQGEVLEEQRWREALESDDISKRRIGRTYQRRVQTHDLVRAKSCLLYTSPSPRDQRGSRMPSSA